MFFDNRKYRSEHRYCLRNILCGARDVQEVDTILTQNLMFFVVVLRILKTAKNKRKPLETLTFSVFPRVIEFGRSDGT